MSAAVAMPNSPLLRASGVVKSFGGVRAVRSMDFEIAAGEIVGLIGPNGSGKSTLLSCLSGDQRMDGGRVEFSGEDATNVGAMKMSRRGLGRTFQNVKVFPALTVYENVLLARNWQEISFFELFRRAGADAQRRADDLLELTEMTAVAGELAGSLSGGQRRLLEFVMALMPRPSLVMLDEAASGVNPTLVAKLRRYLLELRDSEGIAFIIVEHNVDFVFSTVDRTVVMAAGSILAAGTADEVRTNQEVIDAYLGV